MAEQVFSNGPFLLDREALQAVARRQRSGDAGHFAPAIAALCRDADAALREGPWSVMDKPFVPPSGDKHDYMSMSSYVWPDPAKPDGLPYVMRDGVRNPETDRYDEVPLRKMSAAVQTLCFAAFFTGSRAYAERAAMLLRTWFLDPATRMNPHLEFGQCVPGLCTGHRRGIIDTAGTLPHVLDALSLMAAAVPEAWPAGDDAALKKWMADYLQWLLTSEFGAVESQINNNHGTASDVLVASLALHTGQTQLARRRIDEARYRRIAVQIWPDGTMPREIERTMGLHYCVWNLRCMMHIARLGEHVGIDLWSYRSNEGRSIRLAAEWLLPYLDLSKPWPYKQINPVDPQNILLLCRQAAIGLRDSRFDQLMARVPGADFATSRVALLYPRL